MEAFDADAFWARHDVKKWVVILTWRDHTVASRSQRDRRDTKYVGARTMDGALRTARHYSHAPRHAGAYARLATPSDLGCVAA